MSANTRRYLCSTVIIRQYCHVLDQVKTPELDNYTGTIKISSIAQYWNVLSNWVNQIPEIVSEMDSSWFVDASI